MATRRTFTPDFKAQVVLELLFGAKTSAARCRQDQLAPVVLARWKAEFMSEASRLFDWEAATSAEQHRIAELERLVGRLTPASDGTWTRSTKYPSGDFFGPPEEVFHVSAQAYLE
jgi:transposase